MSKNFYTNVARYGNNILYRGVKNGRRIRMKVQYAPTLFLPSNKKTEWKSLKNEYLEPMKFETMRDASDFLKRYEDVSNFKIYGNASYPYAFIADEFPSSIEWDSENVAVDLIDIEVDSENGFPDPYIAKEPVTAITTIRVNGTINVYGCGEYKNSRDDVIYHKCADEYNLLKTFLSHFEKDHPDILSGWNSNGFDIVYLVNRITRILGEDSVNKLSPWGAVREKFVNDKYTGQKIKQYELLGIACLDYIQLYKGYAPDGKSQESYRLDHITYVELKERKLSYEEYENLHTLYRKNYQLFIDYNIRDAELILKLDDKLKLFDLVLSLAYDTKSNYEDVFTQTRMWDALIYNNLISKKIVVPPKTVKEKDSAFEGAYVKPVQVGRHAFPSSFDLDSLYPHLMMQYNLSPETLIEPEDYTQEMRDVLAQNVSVESLLDKKIDLSKVEGVCLTPNGQFFRKDIQGFIPKMLEEMYEDRKKFKKLMLQAEQEYELCTDEEEKKVLIKKISKYKNLQLAKKLNLNSCYGIMGSKYFRFFDLRLALAVTQTGQLSIQWIEQNINRYMNSILKTNADYVIASDTDSIYLRLGELVDSVFPKQNRDVNKIIKFMDRVCEEKLQPFINKTFEDLALYMKAHKQKMRMKRECLADVGIWIAKKRYVLNVYNNEGVQYKEPQLKIKGLQIVQSSTPQIVREKMEETLLCIVQKTEADVQNYVANFRNVFMSYEPEDIAFPRSCNGLSEYADSSSIFKKGTPIQVKGALIYNHELKMRKLENRYQIIKEGEKLKFLYLKSPNPVRQEVISFPTRLPEEFGLKKYVDYNKQFEKTYLDPIQSILDCIGWKAERTNTLANFFS